MQLQDINEFYAKYAEFILWAKEYREDSCQTQIESEDEVVDDVTYLFNKGSAKILHQAKR